MQEPTTLQNGVLSPEIWTAQRTPGFELIAFDRLSFERDGENARRNFFSPFVWHDDEEFHAVVRAVPRDGNEQDGGSTLVYARGDGQWFRCSDRPILSPGDEDDAGGCEDATVLCEAGQYVVLYTGVTSDGEMSRLLYATGSGLTNLQKRGRIVFSPDCGYCKEASVLGAGDTRFFYFETRADGKSTMSAAAQDAAVYRWRDVHTVVRPRDGMWDCAHVSTGPVVQREGRAWMFYNGCDDAGRWRIGRLTIDPRSGEVLERSEQPLFDRAIPMANQPDILFATSAVDMGDELWLYGTLGDEASFRLRLAVTY